MDKKTAWKMRWFSVKEFLPTFRSKKGSPTMEYVVIIAVGAVFALILFNLFDKDEGGKIKTELGNKVQNIIKGGDPNQQPQGQGQ